MGQLLSVDAEPSPADARRVGAAVLVAAGATLLTAGLLSRRARRPKPIDKQRRAARRLNRAAALLAGSVFADSAVEHYRAAFANPGMVTPLALAGTTLLIDGRGDGSGLHRDLVHVAAVVAGTGGLGFHVYNVLRRQGGARWGNLFYGAPLGAPLALSLAGLIGLAADRVGSGEERLLGLPTGRALAGLTGAGIAGTVGEAWLFHFRGAFHNPVMWAPIALPPVASALLLRAAAAPGVGPAQVTRAWLGVTALLGLGGASFHVYGVSRHMGGWRNWSQNLLDGPPIPAPPSFTALALAGLSALDLIEQGSG